MNTIASIKYELKKSQTILDVKIISNKQSMRFDVEGDEINFRNCTIDFLNIETLISVKLFLENQNSEMFFEILKG